MKLKYCMTYIFIFKVLIFLCVMIIKAQIKQSLVKASVFVSMMSTCFSQYLKSPLKIMDNP